MARARPTVVTAPFTVLVDQREKLPYQFVGLRTNADQGSVPIVVPLEFRTLTTGDYGLLGYPRVCIERKSKPDLYMSIAQKRANFEGRLKRMAVMDYAAIVVEAEFYELIRDPPPFTQFNPKALARTLIAWSQRFAKVHFWFMPGRDAAESLTFRIFERYFLDHQTKVKQQ
jgi:ERCC4-type nuclease